MGKRLGITRPKGTISDPDRGGAADHRFHAALVDSARSDTLATLYGGITALLLRSHRNRREALTSIEDGRAYLTDHHRLIIDALTGRDPRRADEILREHFAIGDEYRRRRDAAGRHPAPQAAPHPIPQDATQ